jgi:hypothetical protein
MASQNVDKALKALREDPVLALELSVVLAKIESAAAVHMTKLEKKEFIQELSNAFSQESIVVVGWF